MTKEERDQLIEIKSLIQEARNLALTGEYGTFDCEYPDVKVRFDRSLEILQSLIDENQ